MSRKARRKQLTVVPTFSRWPARLLEANHPHRCLHSFLRWNAVATGKEKRQLHKPTVRTRSCMISFFVNRFCQQILKIPQVFRPPGSGNPLIFSSLACERRSGFAINHDPRLSVKLSVKTDWNVWQSCLKWKLSTMYMKMLKVLPGTLSQSLVHVHNVCADHPTKMFDPWQTLLCAACIIIACILFCCLQHTSRCITLTEQFLLNSACPCSNPSLKKGKENACRQDTNLALYGHHKMLMPQHIPHVYL